MAPKLTNSDVLWALSDALNELMRLQNKNPKVVDLTAEDLAWLLEKAGDSLNEQQITR